MEKLDEALVNLRQDFDDQKKQSEFYDLFLNSSFFVPIVPAQDEPEDGEGAGGPVPLIAESDGIDYMIIFSTPERLRAWAQEEAPYIEVPGYLLALSTQPPLHWALNVGTEYSKQFHPEEIAWLRDAVERCNAEAAKAQGA